MVSSQRNGEYPLFTQNLILENLTKEQYSGNYRNRVPMLNSSRDSLNPAVNLETLKNRLWVAEHYRLLHGVEFAYWPHYAMKNVGTHLWKFKFNYAVKAFFIYQVYREYQNYQYVKNVTFLSTDQQFQHYLQIGWNGFLATAVALLI